MKHQYHKLITTPKHMETTNKINMSKTKRRSGITVKQVDLKIKKKL
jgi:hypothetical protein